MEEKLREAEIWILRALGYVKEAQGALADGDDQRVARCSRAVVEVAERAAELLCPSPVITEEQLRNQPKMSDEEIMEAVEKLPPDQRYRALVELVEDNPGPRRGSLGGGEI